MREERPTTRGTSAPGERDIESTKPSIDWSEKEDAELTKLVNKHGTSWRDCLDDSRTFQNKYEHISDESARDRLRRRWRTLRKNADTVDWSQQDYTEDDVRNEICRQVDIHGTDWKEILAMSSREFETFDSSSPMRSDLFLITPSDAVLQPVLQDRYSDFEDDAARRCISKRYARIKKSLGIDDVEEGEIGSVDETASALFCSFSIDSGPSELSGLGSDCSDIPSFISADMDLYRLICDDDEFFDFGLVGPERNSPGDAFVPPFEGWSHSQGLDRTELLSLICGRKTSLGELQVVQISYDGNTKDSLQHFFLSVQDILTKGVYQETPVQPDAMFILLDLDGKIDIGTGVARRSSWDVYACNDTVEKVIDFWAVKNDAEGSIGSFQMPNIGGVHKMQSLLYYMKDIVHSASLVDKEDQILWSPRDFLALQQFHICEDGVACKHCFRPFEVPLSEDGVSGLIEDLTFHCDECPECPLSVRRKMKRDTKPLPASRPPSRQLIPRMARASNFRSSQQKDDEATIQETAKGLTSCGDIPFLGSRTLALGNVWRRLSDFEDFVPSDAVSSNDFELESPPYKGSTTPLDSGRSLEYCHCNMAFSSDVKENQELQSPRRKKPDVAGQSRPFAEQFLSTSQTLFRAAN